MSNTESSSTTCPTSCSDTTASATNSTNQNMEANKEGSIDEFSQVGRTGRRNALHDIFDERYSYD